MKAYLITELAGAEVAGIRNPGINETIHLTPAAAEHPLRLGHIVAEVEPRIEPAVSNQPVEPRKRGRSRKK